MLEDICDNLFSPDLSCQQGGDMVRIGGLQYACEPREAIGRRISDMRLAGEPIDACRRYQVASSAPVAEGVTGEAVWDLVAAYLRDRKVVGAPRVNRPAPIGVGANPGLSCDAQSTPDA